MNKIIYQLKEKGDKIIYFSFEERKVEKKKGADNFHIVCPFCRLNYLGGFGGFPGGLGGQGLPGGPP